MRVRSDEFEHQHAIAREIVGALEALAGAGRPGHRRDIERQGRGDLVQKLDRVAALAVHLVDEGDDRHVAQAADLEQLAGPRLDALGGVDHHDRRIDRGQGAVGVLAEILVARRVQQIEHRAAILEMHHRGGDRDAALLLDLHPVRARPPASPRALTAPATWMAPPNSSSFSVSVVLPASGWEMIAKVRLQAGGMAGQSGRRRRGRRRNWALWGSGGVRGGSGGVWLRQLHSVIVKRRISSTSGLPPRQIC